MTPGKEDSLGSLTHLQASVISAFTFIVGQLVAFVPTLGPDKQNLISGGSTVIAAAFLIANAIHASKATPAVAAPVVVPAPAAAVIPVRPAAPASPPPAAPVPPAPPAV